MTMNIYVAGDKREDFLARLKLWGAKIISGNVTLIVPTTTAETYQVTFVNDPKDAFGILVTYDGSTGYRSDRDRLLNKTTQIIAECRGKCPDSMMLAVAINPSLSYDPCCWSEVPDEVLYKYHIASERSSLNSSYLCLSDFLRVHSKNPYLVMQVMTNPENVVA